MAKRNDLLEAIKERIEIPDYMEQLGYHVKAHGIKGKLTLTEHDSFVYDPATRRAYWNSRGFDGDIIDLYGLMNGCDAKESIRQLRNMLHDPGSRWHSARAAPPRTEPKPVNASPAEPKAFTLPKSDPKNLKYVYAYLINRRCIDPDIVKWLQKNGAIYADGRRNLCFASRSYGSSEYDYAAQKGTGYDPKTNQPTKYRHAVEGGNFDARYSVNMVKPDGQPTLVKKIFVCEAAVDVFSIMSFLKMNQRDFTEYGYLSLEGCHEAPLGYHIRNHHGIAQVYLAQDHDEAGNNSRIKCRRLLDELGFSGRCIDKIPYSQGGDWNSELQTVVQQQRQVQEQSISSQLQQAMK